ncbi:MAG: hypothetical protein ABIJ50_06940 [Pseudomonadota bacterium]
MIVNPGTVQSAYQATAPKAANSAQDEPILHFEVTTFESLLSDSDTRTIAAMDKYAAQNGIPEGDMNDIKSAIMAEKYFSLRHEKQLPEIDRNLLNTIAAGADAGRLDMDSRFVKMLIADFNQLQGISIKA